MMSLLTSVLHLNLISVWVCSWEQHAGGDAGRRNTCNHLRQSLMHAGNCCDRDLLFLLIALIRSLLSHDVASHGMTAHCIIMINSTSVWSDSSHDGCWCRTRLSGGSAARAKRRCNHHRPCETPNLVLPTDSILNSLQAFWCVWDWHWHLHRRSSMWDLLIYDGITLHRIASHEIAQLLIAWHSIAHLTRRNPCSNPETSAWYNSLSSTQIIQICSCCAGSEDFSYEYPSSILKLTPLHQS
jgi:hypothetical protein